ncbi:MAG: DUF1080 domain-containing protein [Phycisphaerae bacterium]
MRHTAIGLAAALAVAVAAPASAAGKEEGFVPLLGGKNLDGWKGDEKLWHARDGVLVGKSPGIRHNDFLCTEKTYGDFVLRFEVRLRPDSANSGVQFRSKPVPNSHEVAGYQADIAAGWWGKLYDEARRRKVLAGPDKKTIERIVKPGGWNAYEVRAEGAHIVLKVNGTKTVDYTEPEPPEKIARKGIIAVQIHSGGPLTVEFRNLRIKELK